MSGGFWITLAFLLELLAFLYVTNPKHKRVRRVLARPIEWLIGFAVRIGLID